MTFVALNPNQIITPSWPLAGSPKPSKGATVPSPAVGTEITWTAAVPLMVIGLQFILTTSSRAGRRTPFIVGPQGASVISATPRGQPPSTSVQYQVGQGYGFAAGPKAQATSIALLEEVTMNAGDTLTTFTVGGVSPGVGLDVADQYFFVAWQTRPL